VKQSARTSDVFTVSKLIPLLLFIVVGLFVINPPRFTLTSAPTFGSFTSAVFVLVYVFSGFEAVLINSGEVRQPRRAIPFALTVALSASVVLFLLIQIVCIGVLPDLANSQRPLADAAYTFLGTAGPVIISIGALVSIFGTLNVIMLACTRLPFAMAAQNQLPIPLARVHNRFRTPHISILICAVAALLIALPGTFIYAVKITVITRVIVYASTCVALPILRRRRQAFTESSFKVPGGVPISIVCVALCFWLLASSDWREARDVTIAIAAGLIVYRLTRMMSNSRDAADIEQTSASSTDYAD
jgi:APA family basic amino acid/polyamine antiporter